MKNDTKKNNRPATVTVAKDGFGNEIKVGDAVRFACGTWRGLTGEVRRFVVRGSNPTGTAVVKVPGEGIIEERVSVLKAW